MSILKRHATKILAPAGALALLLSTPLAHACMLVSMGRDSSQPYDGSPSILSLISPLDIAGFAVVATFLVMAAMKIKAAHSTQAAAPIPPSQPLAADPWAS